MAQFGLPWPVAVGGIFALELGGVVFLSNAEVRRRLGEHASVSRLLGAVVAGAAATFNVLTHHSLLLGGFFALMSLLGFLAWTAVAAIRLQSGWPTLEAVPQTSACSVCAWLPLRTTRPTSPETPRSRTRF